MLVVPCDPQQGDKIAYIPLESGVPQGQVEEAVTELFVIEASAAIVKVNMGVLDKVLECCPDYMRLGKWLDNGNVTIESLSKVATMLMHVLPWIDGSYVNLLKQMQCEQRGFITYVFDAQNDYCLQSNQIGGLAIPTLFVVFKLMISLLKEYKFMKQIKRNCVREPVLMLMTMMADAFSQACDYGLNEDGSILEVPFSMIYGQQMRYIGSLKKSMRELIERRTQRTKNYYRDIIHGRFVYQLNTDREDVNFQQMCQMYRVLMQGMDIHHKRLLAMSFRDRVRQWQEYGKSSLHQNVGCMTYWVFAFNLSELRSLVHWLKLTDNPGDEGLMTIV